MPNCIPLDPKLPANFDVAPNDKRCDCSLPNLGEGLRRILLSYSLLCPVLDGGEECFTRMAARGFG